MRPIHARLAATAACMAILVVGACSGGGSGGGTGTTPAPPATATPTPTPATPTPTPSPVTGNDTAEYRATVGAVSMNALVAYNAGATGSGIRVGVIDSGIDLDSQEFGTRINAASTNTAGGSTIDDEGGHGTAVAFTIAGRRNGAGTHGVAFDAELIVLRTDSPGSCASEAPSDPDSGCSHSDSAIAQALDVARTNGARVVNISLGGSPPNSQLIQAISRATAAGMILVMSAGNSGPDAPNPDSFTNQAANPATGRGLIIIAGSVGAGGSISTFSNRAGTSANWYLAAVGESVRAPDENGTPFLWSGTSFSAPQIAGAVALLAQAFPNLTGAEIVQILYQTARDAGTPGVDAIYGQGILDLTRAFQPVGATSLAGSRAPVTSGMSAALSAPMGDAAQGPLGAVILDGFDRAFAVELGRSIVRDGPARRLPALMAARQRSVAVGLNDLRLALSILPGEGGVQIARLGISAGDTARARALAASVTGRLGVRSSFAIGADESGTALSARLAGRVDPAFLVARDPALGNGFDSDAAAALAFRRSFGPWGVTVSSERGDVLARYDSEFAALRWRRERLEYARTAIGLDRRIGPLGLGLTASVLDERDTVLGARFASALGAARARSGFVDASLRWNAADGWTIGASMRQGWTRATMRGGIDGGGTIRSNGFAADAGKSGVLVPADFLGLRIAQPLRVTGGGIAIRLPEEWDYATETVSGWRTDRINLAPVGREIDFEIGYLRDFGIADFGATVFYRRDPGNFAHAADDRGGAVRVRLGF